MLAPGPHWILRRETILWQKADPNGAVDLGPLAVANGVVYAPSMGGPAFGAGSCYRADHVCLGCGQLAIRSGALPLALRLSPAPPS